jgi:nitroreductase
MPVHPFDIAVTDRLLTTTRAVRRRLDLTRPVEREVLLDCVRIAQQAPTGGNAQNWRFVIVTDPGKRAGLAKIYNEAGKGYLEQQRSKATDPQTRRVYESAVYLTEILAQVPVHVVPCMVGRVPAGAPPFAFAASYANIIPAAWSFMLAARSRGLGSVWTSLHLQREQEAAELLGIPANVTQVALIPVAYYTGDDFSPVKRPAPETIVSWDSWQG